MSLFGQINKAYSQSGTQGADLPAPRWGEEPSWLSGMFGNLENPFEEAMGTLSVRATGAPYANLFNTINSIKATGNILGPMHEQANLNNAMRSAMKPPSLGTPPGMPSMSLSDYMNSQSVKSAVADQINNMSRPTRRAIKNRKQDRNVDLHNVKQLRNEGGRRMEVIGQETDKDLAKIDADAKARDAERRSYVDSLYQDIASIAPGTSSTEEKTAAEAAQIADRNAEREAASSEIGTTAREQSKLSDQAWEEYLQGSAQQESKEARRSANKDIGEYRAQLRDTAALAPQLSRELANQELQHAMNVYNARSQAFFQQQSAALQAAKMAQENAQYMQQLPLQRQMMEAEIAAKQAELMPQAPSLEDAMKVAAMGKSNVTTQGEVPDPNNPGEYVPAEMQSARYEPWVWQMLLTKFPQYAESMRSVM